MRPGSHHESTLGHFMSIRSILVGTLLLTTGLTACFGDLFSPQDGPISVIPDSLGVLLAVRTPLQVKRDGGGNLNPRSVTWSSFGEAIVTVNPAGEVTGVDTGTASVVAEQDGSRAVARVTVLQVVGDGVATGRLHSCVWADGGTAFCWGYNSHGQLGSDAGEGDCGGFPCHFRPEQVTGGLAFSDMAAGDEHTCGLTGSGQAYCWGRNDEGQLGTGSPGSGVHAEPAAVVGGHVFAAVAAGRNHSCGLTGEGAAYCWGENTDGQLGNGGHGSSAVPVAVVGGLRFTALAAGSSHTCGLAVSGAVHCWGANEARQLGSGNRTSSTSPIPVVGGRTFVAIAVGDVHACGVTAGNEAYCWGGNAQGQLGNGSLVSSSEPTLVADRSFTGIAAGSLHSCGIQEDDETVCWGSNAYRQIGDNAGLIRRTRPDNNARTEARFATLAAGWLHTCGATASGHLRCWGYNGAGQLGRPDSTVACPGERSQLCSRTPIRVIGSR